MAPYYGTALGTKEAALAAAEEILHRPARVAKPGHEPDACYAGVYDKGPDAGRYRYHPVVGPNDVRV